jgi:RNA polymerase sigma-70 factor (ECF subfamily)
VTPSTAEVWEAFHRQLFAFIRRRVDDPQDAEDILQDVFLRVHSRLDGLRDRDRLAPWLYQVARHAVIDHYRLRRPDLPLPDGFPADPSWSGSADQADAWAEPDPAGEIASGLRDMIATLPGNYREVLLLSEIQGLKHKDIAARLGLSLSGVKSRVQRGRELLRQDLWSCCHFEFDRRGHLINYQPRPDCCRQCCEQPPLIQIQ